MGVGGRLETGDAAGVWRGPGLEFEGGVWKDLGWSWGPTLELGARAGVGREPWRACRGAWSVGEISGETCVGWGEDTKLEAGEV